MTDRSHKRTLLLFGALSVYIVLQFTWWAVLLLRKDREALQLALEVQALGGPIVAQPDPDRGLRMIVGEASVFFAFLVGILFLTFRAVKRDLALVRTQQNFLLAVTHELRTPLTSIVGYLDLLEEGRFGDVPESMERPMASLRRNAHRLKRLVDEMLDQRIVREFERLDRELQTLRDNQKTMVTHIHTLEAELTKHGIPFTPLEIL